MQRDKEWFGSERVDSGVKNNEVPFELRMRDKKGEPSWNDLGEELLEEQVQKSQTVVTSQSNRKKISVSGQPYWLCVCVCVCVCVVLRPTMFCVCVRVLVEQGSLLFLGYPKNQ